MALLWKRRHALKRIGGSQSSRRFLRSKFLVNLDSTALSQRVTKRKGAGFITSRLFSKSVGRTYFFAAFFAAGFLAAGFAAAFLAQQHFFAGAAAFFAQAFLAGAAAFLQQHFFAAGLAATFFAETFFAGAFLAVAIVFDPF